MRWYECMLVERDPPPGREGMNYRSRIQRRSVRDLRSAWREGPLKLIAYRRVDQSTEWFPIHEWKTP